MPTDVKEIVQQLKLPALEPGKAPAKTAPLPKEVKATGNPWEVCEDNPATVPLPTDVIITKVEGPYTERDRKLWVFLIHAVWDDLLTKRLHEIPVSKINKIFHELGGEKTASWIWECARRLTRTIVEWEEGPDAKRLIGISNLMNARTSKEAQASGILWFEIPALLSEVIKKPFRFSRLRLHFMIGLSGKYAVTFYMLLEGAVNMKNPVLEIELSQLRQWLKVPEGKLLRFVDLKRRALEPAIKQINDNPEASGFTVKMEAIKGFGRGIERVRFSMAKSEGRIEIETKLKPDQKTESRPARQISGDFKEEKYNLPPSAWEKARQAAPGYDVYALADDWRYWCFKNNITPRNNEAHFIDFCKKKPAMNRD